MRVLLAMKGRRYCKATFYGNKAFHPSAPLYMRLFVSGMLSGIYKVNTVLWAVQETAKHHAESM